MKNSLNVPSPLSRLSLLAACLVVCTLFTLPNGLVAADPMKLAPESAVLFVELARPETILDPALDPATRDLFKGVDAYRKYLESPQYAQLLMVKPVVEARLGTSWQAAARDILGGGVYLAVDAANSSALLFVRGRKPELLTRLNDLLIELIEGDAKNNGRPSPVKSEEHHGVRGWTFGGEEAHTIIDDLLVISNKSDALKGVIDRWRDPDAKGLASVAAFQQARGEQLAGAVAWLWTDLAAVRKVPNVEAALAKRSTNPLGELLIGGVIDAARDAPFTTASLRLDGGHIRLRAELPRDASKTAASRAWFFAAQADQGAPAALSPKGTIGTLTAFRDLAGLWLARDELFDEKTVAGFAQADTQLGLFFSGLDFGPEVLGELLPGFQFIVARQEFSAEEPVPALKLPAMALVLSTKHPEEFAGQLLLAYQKIVGLTNIVGGQQGQPQLMLSTEECQGATINKAVYMKPPKGTAKDKAPTNYNFSPACARVGEHFIYGSTVGIVRQLIERLTHGTMPATDGNISLALESGPLAAILEDNRELLITQNMLSEGRSRQEAEQAIATWFQIVRLLDRAQVRLVADAKVVSLELSAEIAPR
ncbi:MAG TPA: hypothetical protein VND64_28700 [Pirellulales bacterium]|nr:hypothetical protein [Pirellulales bacterium]